MPDKKGDPAPENLDAMTAAYQSGDTVAIAREKAAYNEQLIRGGHTPLYDPPKLWGETDS